MGQRSLFVPFGGLGSISGLGSSKVNQGHLLSRQRSGLGSSKANQDNLLSRQRSYLCSSKANQGHLLSRQRSGLGSSKATFSQGSEVALQACFVLGHLLSRHGSGLGSSKTNTVCEDLILLFLPYNSTFLNSCLGKYWFFACIIYLLFALQFNIFKVLFGKILIFCLHYILRFQLQKYT